MAKLCNYNITWCCWAQKWFSPLIYAVKEKFVNHNFFECDSCLFQNLTHLLIPILVSWGNLAILASGSLYWTCSMDKIGREVVLLASCFIKHEQGADSDTVSTSLCTCMEKLYANMKYLSANVLLKISFLYMVILCL